MDANNVLHICPGGGYGRFAFDDYHKLMSEAAQNLDEAPVAWYVDGRHIGDTGINFEQWQKS